MFERVDDYMGLYIFNHIKYTCVLSEDVKFRTWGKKHLTLNRDTNARNRNASDVDNHMEEGKWISVKAFKAIEECQ